MEITNCMYACLPLGRLALSWSKGGRHAVVMVNQENNLKFYDGTGKFYKKTSSCP